MLISIICILFLSFLSQKNTPYNFKKDNINGPIKELQISSSEAPEQLWNTTWGGSGYDGGSDIAIDSSNNIYLSGFTNSFGAGDFDIVLVKYNSLGERQWNTTWGGSDFDSGLAIEIDSSNNIYIGGFTRSFGAGGNDMVLVKYNSLGQQQWNTTWGGSGVDIASGVALDSSNNIYLAGRTVSFGAGSSDMVLVKYNSLGQQQWNTTWGGSLSDTGNEVVVDFSDNVYLVGYTTSFGAGGNDMVLVKYNSLGQQQWNTTWGGANHDLGYALGLDSSNNIYITGGANSTFFDPFHPIETDIVLVKYNSLGEQQWNTTWGGSVEDSGHAIAINSSNNIYLAGRTDSFGAGDTDMVLVKYNSSGEQQWNTTWGGIGNDFVNEIEIDSSNNIYITGGTNSSGAGYHDMVLIKYGEVITSNGDGGELIPGYDFFLLFGVIGLISAISIKKRYKSIIS